MAGVDALVATAVAGGSVELDLSGCQPKLAGELPASICDAIGARLVKLNAPGHALTALPPSFASLSRLRVLFFLGNAFDSVPAVLGGLPSLFMLSFKGNAIADVPDGSLPPSLGWLILTDNRIPRLPRSFGALTGLRKLMLASNRLTSLPDEIALCTSLELVRLSNNLLESLPPGFLRLPRLAWVALAGNPLSPSPPAAPGVAQVPRDSIVLGPRLGDGASGTVFEASLGADTVAVKVFKASSSDGRPEDEVAIALALPSHPCLIETRGFFHDAPKSGGSDAGLLGLVMEIVRGDLLGRTPSFESVTRDTFPPDTPTLELFEVADVARGIAAALAHMHAHRVCHGDVYAHNILVCRGDASCGTQSASITPKLGDLGAAWAVPAPLAAAANRFDVRGFGCLLEDLMRVSSARGGSEPGVDSPQLREVRARLESVATLCLNADVDSRPTMAAVVELLRLK